MIDADLIFEGKVEGSSEEGTGGEERRGEERRGEERVQERGGEGTGVAGGCRSLAAALPLSLEGDSCMYEPPTDVLRTLKRSVIRVDLCGGRGASRRAARLGALARSEETSRNGWKREEKEEEGAKSPVQAKLKLDW
eukprot:CAMPEP_0205929722 /NCGR_PEP_ID=MMETSP1325-20131115/25473_1 /ASSEMBLY_ACC=CAM_ASM_000708 /TAXON_ID=236786 /ORGANISM="Florenciella sp., Strain RCC1007" /LENGTH=136 /DNA_ID=CAMNT_0053298985 /DNA_START=185 /DNA_END=594 /DNA_ORIENTATION=-